MNTSNLKYLDYLVVMAVAFTVMFVTPAYSADVCVDEDDFQELVEKTEKLAVDVAIYRAAYGDVDAAYETLKAKADTKPWYKNLFTDEQEEPETKGFIAKKYEAAKAFVQGEPEPEPSTWDNVKSWTSDTWDATKGLVTSGDDEVAQEEE